MVSLSVVPTPGHRMPPKKAHVSIVMAASCIYHELFIANRVQQFKQVKAICWHIHMRFVSNQDATHPAGWLVILQEMTSSKISSRTPTEVVAYLSPSVLVSTWKLCYKDQFVPCESQGSLFSCLHTRDLIWDSEMIENEFSLEGFGWFHAVLPSLWKVYSQCTVTCRETELL